MFKVILLLIACLMVSTIAFSTRPFGVIRKTSISMAIDAFGRPVRASAAPAKPAAPVKSTPTKATPTKATPTKATPTKPVASVNAGVRPGSKSVGAPSKAVATPAAPVNTGVRPGSKSVGAPSKASATPVKSAVRPGSKSVGAPKKDMTWGGRPNPTPELVVDEKADFWYFLKAKK